ncbi:tol-pal system YbgF family protein [Microlunatus sp. Gsoil 973]|uniref:tetratricopeptide repeat protein n=1 Tax=Microlunatus sp. Gsoil 973 TaxID=2672569 RepID=UPI0012B4B88F|nr:tetratricopeptide repeat protein [Microlunatus sp. Gsoil 973]QGN33270.1 tetratricopeptide repeat protein [Microlunatus sp. Gsoil 973]
MGAERDRLADVARAAVEAGDWTRARRAFESLVERDATAEALLGLGDTLWWLGETANAIRNLERAYRLELRRRRIRKVPVQGQQDSVTPCSATHCPVVMPTS